MTSATPPHIDPRTLQPIGFVRSRKQLYLTVAAIVVFVAGLTVATMLVLQGLTRTPSAQQLTDSYTNGFAHGNLKGYNIGYQHGLEDAPTVVGVTLQTPWSELAMMNAKFIPGAVPPHGDHAVIHDLIQITPVQYESVLVHYNVTDDMTTIHLSKAVLSSMVFAEEPNHDYTLVFGN